MLAGSAICLNNSLQMKGLTPSEPVIRISVISVGFAGEAYESSKDHRYHNSDNPQHPAFRAVSVLVARAAYFASRAQQPGLRLPILVIIAASFAFLWCAPVRAQEDEVVRVRTDFVAVPLVVTDSRGRRIPNLQQADFVVSTDRGKPAIDYFAAGTDRVALLFAIDVSGSTREVIARQKQAASELYSRFGAGSRVAVLHFSDVARLAAGFTTDVAGATKAFDVQAAQNTKTAIFDAAAIAVRSFDGSGGFSTERRIVILLSDGLDTLSSAGYQTVVEAAQKRGVSFYVIHFQLFAPIDGVLKPRPASKGFRELAEKTGGAYFRVGDARSALNPKMEIGLTKVFAAIDEDLRGQYVIGFYPGEIDRDNGYHPVNVTLASPARRKLHVQQFVEGYDLKP